MAKEVKAKKKAPVAKLAKKPAKKMAPLARGIAKLAKLPAPANGSASPAVLDRLWEVVTSRKDADPNASHSARLMSRGTPKVAQKFGEEAVECVIEAITGNRQALICESADVLYHLIVMWVNAGVQPGEVWAELERREGVSGIAEKAARAIAETRKIP